MRPRAARCAVAAGLAALVAASASACAQKPTRQEAQVKFCEDMLAFEGAVSDLAAMSPADTTVDQVRSSLADAGDALTEMRATAVEIDPAQVQDLQHAYDSLRTELQGVGSIEELRQAAPELRATGADLASAFGSILTDAGCNGPGDAGA